MLITIFLTILIIATVVLPWGIARKKKGKVVNSLWIAGIAYILYGILLIISIWWLYIGVASFALGVLFLFLHSKNISPYLSLIIIFFPIVLAVLLYFHSMPSKNIFLIPENFEGRVLIVHNCDDGESREYERFKRVYRIPASGILKTQFGFAGSSFDHLNSEYYFVDEWGNRRRFYEKKNGGASSSDIKVAQLLWTLPVTRRGDTPIDFVVDLPWDDRKSYPIHNFEKFQKAIDDCAVTN